VAASARAAKGLVRVSRSYLRLSVTSRCDYRCVYCRPHGETLPAAALELDAPTLLRLVEAVDRVYPLGKIRLTGGEPLLRSDVPELVAALRRRWPAVELALTTNGSRLAQLAGSLRQAGLDRLNVSLDGADDDSFRAVTGGAPLEPVLDGLAAARDAGFAPPRLNAVLMRRHGERGLLSLVRLAATLGCELRFIELMPLGPATALEDEELLTSAAALGVLQRELEVVRALPRSDTARRYLARVGGREVVVGFISPVSEPFCSGCNRLRLDSRGWLFPCLREGDGVDLLAALRLERGAADALRGTVKRPPAPGAWAPRRMACLGG
jgi:cyclic pyranopterin phosphate synthase